MKVWSGFGSEHSMNLVMVGHFQSIKAAKDMKKVFDQLSGELEGLIDFGTATDRYSDEVFELLRKLECSILGSFELEQFLYEKWIQIDGEKIVITTEESDVSAFLKLMVLKGAKVEIFSGHDYPDAEYGRGK